MLAAHRSLYRFLALIALATLIVIGLTWGWFAVAFGALLVYPILFVLLLFAGVLKYESWDFGDENCRGNFFRDRYGMMLGPDDSTEAGDNLLASHLWADED